MICLVKDNSIVVGPVGWSLEAILEPLLIAGYDVRDGILYDPDLAALDPVPGVEPATPLVLGAYSVLPVVEIDYPAPDGKILAGRETVVADDRVELRPVWGDLPPSPPEPTLEEVRAAKLATIRTACDAALAPLVAAYPEREVQSWPQQVAEATALDADPTAAAPLIRQMAAARPSLGDTPEERVAELARRIRVNAAAWSAVAGPIIGKRQALEDAVEAAYTAKDRSAMEAVVVDFGGAA